MNERIKELAEQAFVITTDGKIGHVNAYMVEQFAQLIVKECISASRLHPNSTKSEEWQKGYTKGQMDARMLIKQHFGVEE